MTKQRSKPPTSPETLSPTLLTDLRDLIDHARRSAATAVNASLTLMYWRIGQRIRTEVLGGQRAGYGEALVAAISEQWGQALHFTLDNLDPETDFRFPAGLTALASPSPPAPKPWP